MGNAMNYITKGIGGFYYVKTPEGIVECKPRGIFRKQKITPVAGDDVTLETENGAAVILKNNVPRYVLMEFSQVEDEQQAKDEDILEISKRLIAKNKQAYEVLAK